MLGRQWWEMPLQEDHDQFERIRHYRLQLQELVSLHQHLQLQLGEKDARLKELENKVEQAAALKAAHDGLVVERERLSSELVQTHAHHERELTELKDQLDSVLVKQGKAVAEREAQQKQENDQIRLVAKEQAFKIKQLQEFIARISASFRQSQQKLKNKFMFLREDMLVLQKLGRELAQENGELKRGIEMKNNELQTFRHQLDWYKIKVPVMRDEILKLEQEVVTCKECCAQEVQRLKEKLVSIGDVVARKEETINNFRVQNITNKGISDQLKERLLQKAKLADVLASKIQALETENKRVKVILEQGKKESEGQQNLIRKLRLQNKRLQEQNRTLAARLDKLSEAVRLNEVERARLKARSSRQLEAIEHTFNQIPLHSKFDLQHLGID